jgi:hypothetical protein
MARKLKGGWSFEQERRVLELAASSKSVEEIANLMSRSPGAIRKVAIRLGASLSKDKRRSAPTERLKAMQEYASTAGGLKAKGK